jgi:hypothetical protein
MVLNSNPAPSALQFSKVVRTAGHDHVSYVTSGVRYRIMLVVRQPTTVAARSKAWNVFALWSTGIVDSNPIRGMDACVRLFCVCVVLCLGRGLATSVSLAQGALPSVKNDYGTE